MTDPTRTDLGDVIAYAPLPAPWLTVLALVRLGTIST